MGKGGGLGRETAQYVCYEVQNGKKMGVVVVKEERGHCRRREGNE